MKDHNYYIYILTNWNNKVMYIGVTNNLERRIYEHKNCLVEGFTKKYNVKKLVYFEYTNDTTAAIKREKEIKKWRREKKNSLVIKINPEWKDISNEWDKDFSPALQRSRNDTASVFSTYKRNHEKPTKNLPQSISLILIYFFLLFTACSKQSQPEPEKTIPVIVSILPQKFFVEKIGGTHVDVTVMVEPGASPHVYEPKPSQIAQLSQARLYCTMGVEFEQAWLPRFLKTAKNLTVIPLDSGITKLSMRHAEGGHAEHSDDTHTGYDPHVWLAPELVKGMAGIIAVQLCRIDPAHCEEYNKNRELFVTEITSLQESIKKALMENNVDKFIVFHPSWGYFAHEFGLTQIPIEIEGKEPLPKDLAQLIDFARHHAITTIFVQPQFPQQTAETIAAHIGGNVLPIDPLAYQWDANLQSVAAALTGKKR